MAELDEPGDEPNFDLIGSFGLDFFSDDATFVRRRTFVLFFRERVVFNARNDRKLVQTCQSPVILPFRFIQSNKEHLTGMLFTSFAQAESGCFGYSSQKLEAKITIFFSSGIINL